jgi:hypothetical protein
MSHFIMAATETNNICQILKRAQHMPFQPNDNWIENLFYGPKVNAPEAQRSETRKPKLRPLSLCDLVAISLVNLANAMDPSCKSSLSFIDCSCIQDFQYLFKQTRPVSRMDHFEPILHHRESAEVIGG